VLRALFFDVEDMCLFLMSHGSCVDSFILCEILTDVMVRFFPLNRMGHDDFFFLNVDVA